MKESVGIEVKGHCFIEDDLGNVILDKTNAVHPQNLSRVFARALSNEPNYFIHRIAFGNGGTVTDMAYNVKYRTPNDGQSPDVNTWDSRLYNETFSKIINEGLTGLPNNLMGIDPGSADSNGVRVGGGSVPSSDAISIPHISGPGVRSEEIGTISKVVIHASLNKDEPKDQYASDTTGTTSPTTEYTEDDFVFDEIGLYTSGGFAIATGGYHHMNVGNKTSEYDTKLDFPNKKYSFGIKIDDGAMIPIEFTTPANGSGVHGEILFGDLCEAINTGDPDWGMSGISPLLGNTLTITDLTNGAFPTINGDRTYGFLTLINKISQGANSKIEIVDHIAANAFSFIQAIGADITTYPPVSGSNAGYQNSPTTPLLERERLLAHLVFSPIRKARNRRYNIRYTLTINIARTPNANSPI